MNNYERTDLRITEFDREDVIATSDPVAPPSETLPPDPYEVII